MNSLRVLLYETPEDPYMNLAFEEAFVRVLSLRNPCPTLRIWRNKNAAVIGYFQKADEEVKLDVASKYDVAITRRFTGGGAVYHDLGNINYAIAVKSDEKEREVPDMYLNSSLRV
jgi:lipoate-protein ligase A